MNKPTENEKKLEQIAEQISLEEFDQIHEDHIFSEKYMNRKEKLLKRTKQTNTPIRKFSVKKILLIAATAFFVVPTTVFAANELYQWLAQKQDYKVSLSVNTDKKNVRDDAYYKLDLGYLPEGMVENKNSPDKYSYEDNLYKGGFSFVLWKIHSSADFDILYSKEMKETTYNHHKALLVKQERLENQMFDTNVFILFEKEGYVLEAYVGNDVTEEVLTKVLENVSLAKSTKEEASTTLDFDEYNDSLENHQPTEPQETGLSADSERIHQIGETIPINIEQTNMKFNYTVSSVEVFDSLNNFPLDNFNEASIERLTEYKIIDEKNQLIPFKQNLIDYGDGVKTIDTIKETRQMKAKFVYVTATIENVTDQPIEDLYLQSGPELLENKQGTLLHVPHDGREATALTLELDYLEYHGKDRSYYKVTPISGKEVRTIHFGFFVDQDQLSKLFLPAFYYDNFNNLNDPKLNFFDIRQPES
ncbi:hypothetical protein IGI37_001453 [Enterococcus sp. AZ194]|uniref:hypothetical protein n=1 Tax=Enterococcus sp. AZ194 TaxID=2774629 RepID=UPI003F21F113